MLDLVFAIAADPMSLPLWAVVLFAAGMYPIGFMLGAECSPCCGVCGCLPNDQLPDTLTVTFDNLTNQTPGPDLISLSFSSCYGSGAEARVTAPGGDPDTDKGPISEVLLTKAGSGYAKLGRVQPTVTLGGGSGTGATFSVTLSQEQDACKIDYWKVSAISVTGGTGFADGEALTFTVAEGDTEEQAASATVQTTRAAPTLTASVSPGSGASLSVTVVENEYASPATWYVSEVTLSGGGTGYVDGSQVTFTLGSGDIAEYGAWAVIQTNRLEPTITASVATGSGAELDVTLSQTTDWDGRDVWSVASVDVTNGGTGYVDGSPVSFTPSSGDTELYGASATIQTNRLEPTLSAQASIENGSGAVLAATLSQTTDYEGHTVWTVSGITVADGGSGYVEGDAVFISVTDGAATPYSYFDAVVASVDETGAITAVTVNYPGEYFKDGGVIQAVVVNNGGWYFKDGGVIQSVQIWSGGSYYNDDGVPTGVTLTGSGVYYREDATATPYVANVTVTVASQDAPSDGAGATFTATIEDDTSSPDFGKIVALAIDDGGDGYLAWEWKNTKCCGWYWDGKPIVLRREFNSQENLCALTFNSCFGSGASGRVTDPGFTYGDTPGPIESVALTFGGSGYARLGRATPTVTASASPGTGAAFSVSLAATKDGCGLDYWTVSKVTVTQPGSGYTHGAKVSFFSGGQETQQAAVATLSIATSIPSLTATPTGTGGGASLSVTMAPIGTTPETWRVQSISVTAGGSGYVDNKSVSFPVSSPVVALTGATATARTNRLEPTLAARVLGNTGSGASLIPVLTTSTNTDGRTVWGVTGFTIANGGQGYSNNDGIAIDIVDGQRADFLYYGYVDGVDSNGAITSTKIVRPGKFFKDGGIIEVVTLTNNGGSYYHDEGVNAVNVSSGGIYYREDPSLTPYVSPVAVGFSGSCPGTGGAITATVDADTSHYPFGTFGRITALTVTAAGNGYVAPVATPGGYWSQRPCTYSHVMCGGWNNLGFKGHVYLTFRGLSEPPYIVIVTEYNSETIQTANTCNSVFVADSLPTSCSDWSGLTFSQVNPASMGFIGVMWNNSGDGDGTATVAAGGTYDEHYKSHSSCHPCCQGKEDPPSEISVTVEDSYNGSRSGDYVLSRSSWFGTPTLSWGFVDNNNAGIGPGLLTFGISVDLQQCVSYSDDCDQCIKKCQQIHTCGYTYSGPDGAWFWPGNRGSDTRLVTQDPETGNCATANWCDICVEDAPVCRPRSLTTDHRWCFSDRPFDQYPVWFTMTVE